jgi:hypothetical protein
MSPTTRKRWSDGISVTARRVPSMRWIARIENARKRSAPARPGPASSGSTTSTGGRRANSSRAADRFATCRSSSLTRRAAIWLPVFAASPSRKTATVLELALLDERNAVPVSSGGIRQVRRENRGVHTRSMCSRRPRSCSPR